jgi:nucleolar protein 16
LSQNYRRLGLVARLQASTGGVEARHEASKDGNVKSSKAPTTTAFGVRIHEKPGLREARVERDESGRIIRVLRDPNPLNDLLNDFDTEDDDDGIAADPNSADGPQDEWGGLEGGGEDDPRVVRELERQAAQPVEKKQRHQSEREIEWLQQLIDKHGDNTAAMARDGRLNRMQQTEADIAKRIRLWKASAEGT